MHAMLKSSNKKPSPPGKPKRPLSAYNLFFRGERKRILLKSLALQELSPEEFANALKSSKDRPHRKTKGKLSFKALTRQVSSKWKTVDPVMRKMCEDEAKIRKERYNRVLALWKGGNAVNCRTHPVSSDDKNKSKVSLCSPASLPRYLSKYAVKCSTNSSNIVPAPWACPVKEGSMLTSADTSRIFKQERIFHPNPSDDENKSTVSLCSSASLPRYLSKYAVKCSTNSSNIVPAPWACPVKELSMFTSADTSRILLALWKGGNTVNCRTHPLSSDVFRPFTSAPTCTRSEQSFQLKKNSDISVLASKLDEESLDFLASLCNQ